MTNSPTKILVPLTMGQILDRAFRVYRQQFLLLLGIVAAFQAPLAIGQLIQGAVTSQMLNSMQGGNFNEIFSTVMAGSLAGNFFAVVAGVLTQFGYAAMAIIIVHSYLGQSISFREVIAQMRASFWQLVIAVFFIFVLNIALLLYSVVVPILGWFTGFGMLLFTSITIVPLVTPVIVLEKQQALESFRRVWDLTRQRFWWVLGFGTVLYIMAILLAAGPTLLAAGGAQFLLSDGGQATFLVNIVTTLVTLAMGVIFIPIQVSALVVMYLDLRVRFEGFDLAVQADSTGGDSNGVIAMLTQVPAGFNRQLMTRGELFNFFAITIVLLLLMALLFGAIFLIAFAIAATLGGGL